MCIQNPLQQYILEITNGGKDIADFFYATMHGQTRNAQIHHQMDAAKQLRLLGIATGDTTVRPEPGEGRDGSVDRDDRIDPTPSPLTEEYRACPERSRRDEGENPIHPVHPVTDLDIINYEVAGLIREETNDGYSIADFLARVMRGTDARQLGYLDRKDVISEADRMAAAKELMSRGLGKFGDSRSRRLSNSQDDLELIRSGLARYIRERTGYGTEAARFMLDVASGQDEGFSMHQRVVATRELTRRGWDTNYDAITPADITAYYQRQDAVEPTKFDIALQEWREDERAARDRAREDEPQLEPGLFAHLTEAEIARYEAMSAEEQAEFIELQRQSRASRRSAASVTPDRSSVITAQAGIQNPHTPDDFGASTHTENIPEPTKSNQDHEIIDWNALIQEISEPSSTPHPTPPVHPVKSQTRIRSP